MTRAFFTIGSAALAGAVLIACSQPPRQQLSRADTSRTVGARVSPGDTIVIAEREMSAPSIPEAALQALRPFESAEASQLAAAAHAPLRKCPNDTLSHKAAPLTARTAS
ncbi:MAG: hypothetical protein M3081_22330 [Gemmatimonadota bacterium]|nr:hypothetical protein [Gemmatimonadota bacterium]